MKLKLFLLANGITKVDTVMLPNSKRETINCIVNEKLITIMSKKGEPLDLNGTMVQLRDGKDGPIVENHFVVGNGLAKHREIVVE
jgi:hypothetical protein